MGKLIDKVKEFEEKSQPAILRIALTFFAMCGAYSLGKWEQKKDYLSQTRDIIGNSNAQDPNDTYIEHNGQKYFYSIDGKPVEDHFR